MANTLGNFDASFFAMAALLSLKNRKGLVRAVSRRAEADRNTNWQKGKLINLSRATNFGPAQDHVPGVGTTAQDLKGQDVQITLTTHKEVKFKVTDQDLAHGGERLINEHIPVAVDRVADSIENAIYALGHYVGPHALASDTAAADIITKAREVLLNNQCPMDENIFCALDPYLDGKFLRDGVFHAAEKTGQGGNNPALVDGTLGRRFGVNFLTSQLAGRTIAAQTATLAAAAGSGDRAGAIKTAADVNATSVVLKALTNSETIGVNADRFTIAGDPTVYRVTAVSGAVSSNEVTCTIFPALRKPAAEDAVVTFVKRETIEDAAAIKETLMWHREGIALVMAPLSEVADGAGMRVGTAGDPQTGLTLRLRAFGDGNAGTFSVAVDALFGVQLLDPMLCVRMLRAA